MLVPPKPKEDTPIEADACNEAIFPKISLMWSRSRKKPASTGLIGTAFKLHCRCWNGESRLLQGNVRIQLLPVADSSILLQLISVPCPTTESVPYIASGLKVDVRRNLSSLQTRSNLSTRPRVHPTLHAWISKKQPETQAFVKPAKPAKGRGWRHETRQHQSVGLLHLQGDHGSIWPPQFGRDSVSVLAISTSVSVC